mmetsp:Transcript_4371/g.5605  ORF Transcript_4371/g.5605 Transcript_4371/m.5605 type:complete len:96 (+) Transcript_4371:117-404(+)
MHPLLERFCPDRQLYTEKFDKSQCPTTAVTMRVEEPKAADGLVDPCFLTSGSSPSPHRETHATSEDQMCSLRITSIMAAEASECSSHRMLDTTLG